MTEDEQLLRSIQGLVVLPSGCTVQFIESPPIVDTSRISVAEAMREVDRVEEAGRASWRPFSKQDIGNLFSEPVLSWSFP